MVALGAAHTYIRSYPHDAPIIAPAGVRFTQRIYIPKPYIHRLHAWYALPTLVDCCL